MVEKLVSSAAPQPEKPFYEDPSTLVHLEGVHVTYRVYEQRASKLKDIFALRHRRYREINALRGVTFTVRTGEIIGVIGPNGSGKSTLMRAVSGLMPVDQGAVFARGEPALLGVGVVLRPRLSGRRNVYIGSLALGLTQREIDERFDDIVKWAQLENFIDMPMNTYSSGMKARLQFAIATAALPDILLIDEALAVGDKRFRRRSRERLKEVSERAGAVMIVTHATQLLRKLCTRVLWLEDGRLVMDGPPDEVIEAYADED